MVDLSTKKRVAAELLGVGVSRIRLSPEETERIQDAITRANIRALLKDGVIWAEPARGVSRGRIRMHRVRLRRRGRGPGSKEGAAGARRGRKDAWVHRVRALRRHLHILRERGDITPPVFKRLYRQVKGGQVRSVRHLRELMREGGKG